MTEVIVQDAHVLLPTAFTGAIVSSSSDSACFNTGARSQNHSAANKQPTPVRATVIGAPICGARKPDSKLPSGGAPINIIKNKLITRPRSRSGVKVCNSVFAAAIGTMNPEPTSGNSNIESHKL